MEGARTAGTPSTHPVPSPARSTITCGASCAPCMRTTAFSTSLSVPGTGATGNPRPRAGGATRKQGAQVECSLMFRSRSLLQLLLTPWGPPAHGASELGCALCQRDRLGGHYGRGGRGTLQDTEKAGMEAPG